MGKIYEALEWQRRESNLKPWSDSSRTFSIARFNPQQLKIRSSAAPHYEQLKANFLSRYGDTDTKTVMVAGIEPQDGASSTAVYLASLLSRDSQHKVLLLDANLRKPNFRRFFNTESCYSLRNVIAGSGARPISQYLPPSLESGNLYVIPSGGDRSSPNPSGFFQSGNFRQFIGDMREKFDLTVIDAPAVRKNPESIHLSALVDGVILVLNSGSTPRWVVQNVKRQIADAGGEVLGVVLNRRRHYIPDWLYRML